MKIKAKLVAATQPVESLPVDTPEELIAFAARVSSNREYEGRGKDYEGLLNYCIRNKHWSIFEMANAVVELKAPRDISRQLIRHRSFSFQEFSQRYSDDIEFCPRELRGQDFKNRQNSVKQDYGDVPNIMFDNVVGKSEEWYKDLRDKGVAKECARVVLPEGLTMSSLYVNGTFRSWMHYLEVRDDPGVTQWEHVLLAREIRKELEPIMPNILGVKTPGTVFNEYGHYGENNPPVMSNPGEKDYEV